MAVFSLAGRTAAITGATGGIGFAIASRFAKEGARVVLLGRDNTKLEQALNKIQAAGPQQQHTFHVQRSITELSSWTEFAKNSPKIDILVNCAGVTQSALLARTSEDAINNILDTNLKSTVLGCKAIGQHMIKSRKSAGVKSADTDIDSTTPENNNDRCIINVSSLLAYKGTMGTSVYAASKAGILGLTTSLALEYGSFGIRVNAIVPGYISTPMTSDLPESLQSKIPLGRFGTADEVADAAAFLARNPYANNCILNLDGGLSAT